MKKIILNHKSYLSIEEIKKYIKDFPKLINKDLNIVVFPNILYLSLFENFSVEVGCQNFYSETYGDFSGEVNLEALKKMNIHYTMVSHKDRLNNLLDSTNQVKEKLNLSLNNDFKTILAVGENKMNDNPFKLIKGDLNHVLKNINKEKLNNLIILYEPMWINNESQDINVIRKVVIDIKEYFINYYKKDIEVIYGSGVNGNNINDILKFCDGVCLGKDYLDLSKLKDLFDKII